MPARRVAKVVAARTRVKARERLALARRARSAMHVLICTTPDIKGCIAVNFALKQLTARGHRLSVFLSNDEPRSEGAQRCAEMVGPHETSVWTKSIFPFLERTPAANRGPGAYRTWEELRASDDVGVITAVKNKSINYHANLAEVRALAPDLIFSARFQHILKEDLIAVAPLGVLNMHPGALPKYRGLYVDLRAMLQGDVRQTMTLHRISDTGIDTGEVVDTAEVETTPGDSLLGIRLAIGREGVRMMLEEVDRLAAGTCGRVFEHRPTVEEGYYSWPTAADYDDFFASGLRLYHDSDMEAIKLLFAPAGGTGERDDDGAARRMRAVTGVTGVTAVPAVPVVTGATGVTDVTGVA